MSGVCGGIKSTIRCTSVSVHLPKIHWLTPLDTGVCLLSLIVEKQKVAVIVDQVSKKAAEIGAVKDDAETDLAAAKPALDEALSALNSITQKDIVGLKALKSPPDIVKRIFDCVLLLRHWPIDKVGS